MIFWLIENSLILIDIISSYYLILKKICLLKKNIQPWLFYQVRNKLLPLRVLKIRLKNIFLNKMVKNGLIQKLQAMINSYLKTMKILLILLRWFFRKVLLLMILRCKRICTFITLKHQCANILLLKIWEKKRKSLWKFQAFSNLILKKNLWMLRDFYVVLIMLNHFILGWKNAHKNMKKNTRMILRLLSINLIRMEAEQSTKMNLQNFLKN